MSSRFSPSESFKGGLGPFRTARSRPGRQSQSSPARVAGIQPFLEKDTKSPIGFARQHRRTSSAPAFESNLTASGSQPLATPKPRRALPWYGDRAETDSLSHSYSRAPSPPTVVSSSTRPPPGAFRQSLQSLARAGSFSLLRTPKARNSSDTRELYTTTDDEDNSEDGSRFDILSSDPFRSESPIAILDIEELPPPPVPPKPLHIIPPSQLIILEDNQSPTPDSTPTPTSATVAAMRSAFNRMTNSTGKSRIRLLSFIKEVKSPVTANSYGDDEEQGESSRHAPRLNLPDLQADGPLFDASAFQLPEIPLPKRKMRVEGPSLGHAAPPPAPAPPRPPPTTLVGTHPAPSALQLHLHGNGDFEGYIIESPEESLRVPTPPRLVQPLPSPPPASKELPTWIKKFREEIEAIAGQSLNISSFPDRLVLELPGSSSTRRRTLVFQEESTPEAEEPGSTQRRTLVFQEESTPELTYDSVSISSFGKTPRPPTRPIPPTPAVLAPEPPAAGGSDYCTWTPRDLRASLYTIKSSSTWDPDLPIPSIPDQDSSYLSSGDDVGDEDDDLTIRAAKPEPHVFLPAVSKQQAIEEAIRKIQRKAQVERISVIEEQEEDSSSEPSSEPPSPVADKAPIPALFRNASNPFSSPFDSNKLSRSNKELPKPHRKVSLLRKRVLSRSSGSSSKSATGHSRSFSEPAPSPETKRIVIAGKLPLTSRSASERGHERERALPSLPPAPPISAKPQTPTTSQPIATRDYFGHPIYLTVSTPTFEVVPHSPFRTNDPPAVYYPVDSAPLSYRSIPEERSSDFFVEL